MTDSTITTSTTSISSPRSPMCWPKLSRHPRARQPFRVSTLTQVYDHLLGTEMTRTTDFGSYVQSLCLNLAEVQGAPEEPVH
jgi:hypothetical protein